MSGFEIAGVVLGAFPILLEGLRFYISSVETVKTLWRPHRVLTRLTTQVRMESAKLRNTMERLLHDLVDEDEISRLVLDGKGWEDEELARKLTRALGKDYLIMSFMDTIKFMCEDLERLIAKLRIDTSGPKYRQPAKPLTRDRWKEFIIVLEMTEINALLDSIFRQNQNLDSISKSLRVYEQLNWGSQIPSVLAKRYKIMRDHANNLYQLFQRKLSSPECNCTGLHFASMQLEAAHSHLDQHRVVVHSNKSIEKCSSKIMIAFQHESCGPLYDWLEIEVQLSDVEKQGALEHLQAGEKVIGLIEQSRRDPASRQVAQHQQQGQQHGRGSRSPSWRSMFPETLKGPKEAIVSSSVGSSQAPFLPQLSLHPLPAPATTDQRRRVGFDVPPPCEVQRDVITTQSGSLCELLGVVSGTSTVKPFRVSEEKAGLHYLLEPKACAARRTKWLSLEDLLEPDIITKCQRVMIAIQLASTVLHLYETDWLPEEWGARDIFFIIKSRKCQMPDGKYMHAIEPVWSKPLIQRIPIQPALIKPQAGDHTSAYQFGVHNKTIHSLGVVLIELGLEKPIEKVTKTGAISISMEQMTSVSNNMGGQYATVAASCLFGLSTGPGKLDDKKLRNEFYKMVALPLEDISAALKAVEG